MSVTGTSFTRSTIVFVLIGLVALLGIVAASLWLGQRTQAYFGEVIEARDARVATVELRTLLQDIETGQRGYLLTGEEDYLQPYEEALGKVLPAYERLREAVRPFPTFDQSLVSLRTTIDENLSELAETIDLARQGRRDEAIAIVSTNRGSQLMDQARELFDMTIEQADRRQIEGIEVQRNAASWQRWITIAGALVIVAVVAGTIRAAVGYTRELIRARTVVEGMAASLEERIKGRTVDLRRANDEIQRFAYIVTHDLRAPLVNIMGFTSELEEGLASVRTAMEKRPADPDDPFEEQARLAALEDMPEAIGFIRSSTQKMDGLINAILKISREGRRPLKAETIDLGEMLEQTANAVQHQLSEADGEVTIDAGARTIISDRIALSQMIGNLIDNAIKYRDRSKPLAIRLKTRHAPGRRLIIEVEDNGRGIQPEDHERVFELFRRSGVQDTPGEGIGLPHVRGMARAMGGDVTVRSTLGQGATFAVILPEDLGPVLKAAGEAEIERA